MRGWGLRLGGRELAGEKGLAGLGLWRLAALGQARPSRGEKPSPAPTEGGEGTMGVGIGLGVRPLGRGTAWNLPGA